MGTRDVSNAEIFEAKLEAHRYVLDERRWYWFRRALPDGRVIYLVPLLTGNQLAVSHDALTQTFDNTWQYPFHLYGRSFIDSSWRAALGWDGDGEPEGWYRHDRSGRRRPDGTPESEHVRA